MLERADLFHPPEAFLSSPFSFDPLTPNPNPLIIIIIISYLSGVCKYTLIARFREGRRGVHFVITATSRLRRPTEVDGKDYVFVSKGSFSGWWSGRNCFSTPSFLWSIFSAPPCEIGDEAFEEF